MATDPFTTTLQALWALLDSHAGVRSLVRLGGRRKALAPPASSGARLPADLPEVTLAPCGGSVELAASSTSIKAVQEYALVVSAGPAPTESLLPLKWELVRALASAGDNLGLDFVRKVRLGELTEKLTADGWTGRLIVTVEMWFNAQSI